VLHGVSAGHARGAVAAAVMVAMAAVCLYCARDLWLGGTTRAWVLVATMNIAMVALHMPSAGHRHGGGDVTTRAAPGMSTAMAVATVIAAVEVVAAVAVLCQRSRGTAGRLVSP
jgi:hypothetical protein